MIFIQCSPQEHDAIRTRVDYFLLETHRHERWMGLITGECNVCNSTIALNLCRICREPMPTTDQLPWGLEDGDYAHATCAMETMLNAPALRVVGE